MQVFRVIAIILVASSLALPGIAQGTGHSPQIWQDRGDISLLDLVTGSGGTIHEPGARFKFIKESSAGTSPKFEVEDENGTKWKVKLGEEVKSETAATRLVWAVGYFVDDDYYRPHIQVHGLKRLSRGQEFVSGDTVTNVRLERMRKGDESGSAWSWYDNSFTGTRDFNGLRVMMAFINMWDLKEINNGVRDGQYTVTDLGAAFGKTGNSFTRSKGVLKDYAAAQFIENVTTTYVDFIMDSRPFALSVVDVPNYRLRTQMQTVVKRIPIDDVRWIAGRLGQLSNTQIRDAFGTAGFSPVEVDGYTKVVLQRIAELKKL
jgi:hypothetical protein